MPSSQGKNRALRPLWFRSFEAATHVGCLVCLSLAKAWALQAEVPEVATPSFNPAAHFVKRVYTTEHWLPDSAIRTLLQSREGYLWVGTRHGLARYDGRRFLSFKTAPEAACTSLAEDAEGRLWIGTPNGLIRSSHSGTRQFTHVDGLLDDHVLALRGARGGDLWACTAQGINRYRLGDWTTFPQPASRPLSTGTKGADAPAIHEDQAGRVWFCERSGIRYWSPATDAVEEVPLPSPDLTSPLRIGSDGQTNVWLFGATRWCHWRDGHFEPAQEMRGLPAMTDPSLLVDRVGNLWAGGDATGLYRIGRDGRLDHFGQKDGLSDDWITCLLEDREGNLWVGTERGGLNRWSPAAVRVFTEDDGLPDERVWTVCADPRGRVWVGTDQGLALWTEGHLGRFVAPGPLFSPNVRALHWDREGRLWVGTGDSLECLTEGRLQTHRWDAALTANKVRVVKSDTAGNLWVGRESGLMLWRDGRWWKFAVPDGLPHADVRAIQEDQDGSLWVGTFGGGLARIYLQTAPETQDRLTTAVQRNDHGPPPLLEVQTFTTRAGLANDQVWALHLDSAGVLWAGTRGGLSRIEPRAVVQGESRVAGNRPQVDFRINAFTTAHGLFDDVINEILEDDHGRLWFGSDRGIYCIAKSQFEDLLSGKIQRLACRVYDSSDGLLRSETNGQKSQPAGCKTPDGRLWFPTPRGLAVVDPAKLETRQDPPPTPAIQRVVANGSVLFDDELFPSAALQNDGSGSNRAGLLATRPSRQRSLEVHFAATELRPRDRLGFLYRLEGLDPDWLDAGQRQTVIYENLRPGNYTFSVRSSHLFQGDLSSPATFAITFEPYLHEQWFVRIPVMVGLGVVAWAVWNRRRRELRQLSEFAKQEALDRQREHIAQEIHDELGSGLTRLILLTRNLGESLPQDDLRDKLERVSAEAARLLERMREAVHSAPARPNQVVVLFAEVREHAANLLAEAGLNARLDFPVHPPSVFVDFRVSHAARLAVQEALTNVVQHAQATEATVVGCVIHEDPESVVWLEFTVSDNGRGFAFNPAEPPDSRKRRGIEGMRSRIEALGGHYELHSSNGDGTHIRFRLRAFPSHGT